MKIDWVSILMLFIVIVLIDFAFSFKMDATHRTALFVAIYLIAMVVTRS